MKKLYFTFVILFSLLHFLSAQEKDVAFAFEKLYDGLFQADEPGGSILLVKGEETKFIGNYGLSDMKTGEKITESTVFNTGSISKTFVSNAILILHEREQLSITDPISKYFNDFDRNDIANSVTIEHLLSHTSGLPDIRNVRRRSDFFLTAKDNENWDPIKKAEQFNFEPGSKFEYSNPAFNGLALIVEQVSGEKWQSFVQDEIFKKADMPSSTITDGPHPDSNVAHAYVRDNRQFVESDYGEVPTFAAAGNGGIWSTVRDLAKYEKALRNQSFLSEDMLEKSTKPFHPDNWNGSSEPTIGYSWFLADGSKFGLDTEDLKIVYHTGSQGGFRSFFISIPEKDIVYIALFNRPFSDYRNVMEGGLKILEDANWLQK